MTIISIISDIHLPNNKIELEFNNEIYKSDIIILAGDIYKGIESIEWARRIFPKQILLFVPGNHEYYGYNIDELKIAMNIAGKKYGVNVLDNSMYIHNDIIFIGSTLWTDFKYNCNNIEQTFNLAYAQKNVHDYYHIYKNINEKIKILSTDILNLHNEAIEYLNFILSKKLVGKIVVITHHAPHDKGIHSKYRKDEDKVYFASNLENLIKKYKPLLWVHGHTHIRKTYFIGQTQIITNSFKNIADRNDFYESMKTFRICNVML